jgi:hypothetical protein
MRGRPIGEGGSRRVGSIVCSMMSGREGEGLRDVGMEGGEGGYDGWEGKGAERDRTRGMGAGWGRWGVKKERCCKHGREESSGSEEVWQEGGRKCQCRLDSPLNTASTGAGRERKRGRTKNRLNLRSSSWTSSS